MTSIRDNTSQWVSHPSMAQPGISHLQDKLYVVTMLENPVRYRTRYQNYWAFEKHMRESGAELYVAEIAFGDRQHEITSPDNPNHLQLRTRDEIWHKENALNLLIHRLPADAKYIAWLDADIQFVRPDWVQETMHLLQSVDIIQMFSEAIDLNSFGEMGKIHQGMMKCYVEDVPSINAPGHYHHPHHHHWRHHHHHGWFDDMTEAATPTYWHPGYAWAARKDALNKLGGLIDWAILGSGDWHMAWGLLGRMNEHLHQGLSDNYKNWCLQWEKRAEREIRRNVGYMSGTILHRYHGNKQKRYYGERWDFLSKSKFDPLKDLVKDHQGLWQLNSDCTWLRDGIRSYNRLRDEDDRS